MRLKAEVQAADCRLPALRRGIAEEYARHFKHTKLMGGRLGAPIEFQHGALAVFATKADEGRYLSFVFFTDPLDNLDTTGLAACGLTMMLLTR